MPYKPRILIPRELYSLLKNSLPTASYQGTTSVVPLSLLLLISRADF